MLNSPHVCVIVFVGVGAKFLGVFFQNKGCQKNLGFKICFSYISTSVHYVLKIVVSTTIIWGYIMGGRHNNMGVYYGW